MSSPNQLETILEVVVPVNTIPSIPVRFFNIAWALICTSVIAITACMEISWLRFPKLIESGIYVFNTCGFRKVLVPRIITCFLLVYAFAIIFSETIIRVGLRPNLSLPQCDALNVAAMGLYLAFELFVYAYFVEKAVSLLMPLNSALIVQYAIRRDAGPRLKSWLYLFNFFVVQGTYLGLIILQFFFQKSKIGDGECRLERARHAVLSLLCFSMVALIYLTGIFLLPILRVRKDNAKNEDTHNPVIKRLHQVARRTFFGSVIILATISINRIVHVRFNGSQIWLTIDTDITTVTICGVTLCWMSMEQFERRSMSSRSSRRPSHAPSRGMVNNLDWMATIDEPEGYNGPQRNLSGSSTVVTNIEASGTYNDHDQPGKGIVVETRHVTKYERANSLSNSPTSFPSCALLNNTTFPAEPLTRKPSGCPPTLARAVSTSHALEVVIPSSLDEVLAQSLTSDQEPASPGTIMRLFEEELEAEH